MLPVSNRSQGIATLIAIAIGWLVILAYFLMLLANLFGALQEGTSGNLLARVFSFGGLGADQPWLEAYALANVLTLFAFFLLATRALLHGARAATSSPLTIASPAPTPPSDSTVDHLRPPVSLAEAPPAEPLIGHDSEREQNLRRAIELTQEDESVQMALETTIDSLPEPAQRLLIALTAFSSANAGRKATFALGAAILQDEVTASAALRTLEGRSLVDTVRNEAMPPDGDRDRVLRHPLGI
jgi:hypothetical protein